MLNMSMMPPPCCSISLGHRLGIHARDGNERAEPIHDQRENDEQMRCLSSVSLPSPESMLAWGAATGYSTLPPAASIAALAPAVAPTPLSLTARLISPRLTTFARIARFSTRPAAFSAAKSNGVALERVELVQQNFGALVADLRAEADLRQTTLHRHLAAFESGLDLALAGTRELSLVAATGSLAEARSDAAADAHAFFARTLGRLECVQMHCITPAIAVLRRRFRRDEIADLVDQATHLR
jgi:hypothetical protein